MKNAGVWGFLGSMRRTQGLAVTIYHGPKVRGGIQGLALCSNTCGTKRVLS